MTRRISRSVSVALSVIAASVVFPAGAASADAIDLVAGTGQFLGDGTPAFPGIELHVNAKSSLAGQSPSGTFLFRGTGIPSSRGSITCVAIVGNAAVIGGAIEKSDAPLPDGNRGVIMEILDNGEPGRAADQFNFLIVPNPVSSCPSPPFIN